MMNREFIAGIAWGAGSLCLALGASFARKMGYIDGETVTRLVIGFNGLMIAYFGNQMPKYVVPDACARKTRWVGGWSMVLSGIVYAAAFAFAPIPVAVRIGVVAVLSGIAVTIGYGIWHRAKAKAI